MTPRVELEHGRMPTLFLEWQCDERRTMFAALRRGELPRFLAAHLPVVSTLNRADATFPIHSSTKGVGLLPQAAFVDEHLAEIGDCLARGRDLPPRESLDERIEAALSVYGRPERIDPSAFGAIEIFRSQTYHNLLHDARATLLFTGQGPKYLSYQFNCLAEIVGPEDRRFQFLRGMRFLFEMECFHIQQPQYALGYLFRIVEVLEKTPRVAHAEKRWTESESQEPTPGLVSNQ